MNINPIYINDLPEYTKFFRVNPNSIKICDLKLGYILKTVHDWTERDAFNVWLYFELEQLKNIFGKTYNYESPGLAHIDDTSVLGVAFLSMDGYNDECWPKHKRYSDFDITDIWITDLDVSYIKSPKDLQEFYKIYKINEL